MKKTFAIIVAAFLFILAVLPAAADGTSHMNDGAGLLTSAEAARLDEKLAEISRSHSIDVVAVTVDSTDGKTAAAYADDLFDYGGYGIGNDRSGVLLLISIDDRDWHITTCGKGISVFTDYGIDYIGKKITPYLSDGDYAAAFEKFAELCDEFITEAESGKPFDKGHRPFEPLPLSCFFFCFGGAFVIALIAVGSMKGKLKTVRPQKTADTYVRRDSLRLTGSRDRFLYTSISRTPIQQSNSSGSSDSSGGSSTHTSSSGTSHGGGGGKF